MRPECDSSHPEVLQLLADEFAASGFDQKHLIRCICLSKTYQRSSRVLPENKADDLLYSHMPLKMMTADMLFDSLGVALDHPAAEQEYARGARSCKKDADTPRDQFRKFFHAEADDDVGVVEDYTHGVPQALRLMNSDPDERHGGGGRAADEGRWRAPSRSSRACTCACCPENRPPPRRNG